MRTTYWNSSPSTIVLSLVPRGSDSTEGIVPDTPATFTVKFTEARGDSIDRGIYPSSFARVTTFPLICAESRNASFKLK